MLLDYSAPVWPRVPVFKLELLSIEASQLNLRTMQH